MRKWNRTLHIFIFVLVLNLLNVQRSQAAQFQVDVGSFGASHEDFHYDNYYLIKDDPRAALVDLLNFENKNETFD